MKNKNQAIIIKLFLSSLLILLILIIIELFFKIFPIFTYRETRGWVERGSCFGHCYPSNPNGYFPDRIEDKNFNNTPYCIFYNCRKRKNGYYPGRQEEIALVGDSIVFGEGLKEEDTLGYLLDMKFNNVNFRNFGATGANIETVYKAVYKLINKEPNIRSIIYFYNLNDVIISSEIDKRQKYIIDFQNIIWENMEKKNNLISDILSRSIIYTLIEKAIILKRESRLTTKNYLDMYFDRINEEELKETLELLRKINSMAEKSNVKFSVVIYPLLYKDIFGVYPFKSIHNLLRTVCKAYNITCVDALAAFEKYYSLKRFIVHPIDYHPNGSANRLVIDYLVKKYKFLFQ